MTTQERTQRESTKATREYTKQLRIQNLINFANWKTQDGDAVLSASNAAQQRAYREVYSLLFDEDGAE